MRKWWAAGLLAVSACGGSTVPAGSIAYAGGAKCVYGRSGDRLVFACFSPPGAASPRPSAETSWTGDALVLDGVRYRLSKGRVFLVDRSANPPVRQLDVAVPALVIGCGPVLDWIADTPEVKKFSRRD